MTVLSTLCMNTLCLFGVGWIAVSAGFIELAGPVKEMVELEGGLVAKALIGSLVAMLTLDHLMDGHGPEPTFHPSTATEKAAQVGASFKVVGRKPAPAMDDIPTLVAEMRSSFDSGISLPLSKRMEQLQALHRMISENEAAIKEAVFQDLGRPNGETMLYDVALPRREIEHVMHNLKKWTKTRSVGDISLLTFPSTQWLQPQPYGVALVIGTWNFPFMLSVNPLAGAIAAGNTVVLKPCNVSSATAKLQAELIRKYMDPRIVTVVGPEMQGDRHTTAALLKHKFDVIFFTGSPAVGKVVAQGAADHLAKCVLELGGKNPVIVADDADIDVAAKATVWGRMMNAGQQCISPDYVLCSKHVEAQFVKACAKFAKELYPTPEKPGCFGRIVGDSQMKRLINLLSTHGGEVTYGGEHDAGTRYIAPTIVKVNPDSSLMGDEIFGPILPICVMQDLKAAIQFVKDKPKPLSLYIFSQSKKIQDEILANTSAGGVTINGCLWHAGHSGLPFGGVGASGLDVYHGKYTIDCFQHLKPVLSKTQLPDMGLLSDPFFVYPPWTTLKETLLRFVADHS